MLAPLTFISEKNRKVTAVYSSTDNVDCTYKINRGLYLFWILLKNAYNNWFGGYADQLI
jgi:hypothetical protein